MKYLHFNKCMYTCGFRINVNLVKKELKELKQCFLDIGHIVYYKNGTCMYMYAMQTTLSLIDQLHILHKRRP